MRTVADTVNVQEPEASEYVVNNFIFSICQKQSHIIVCDGLLNAEQRAASNVTQNRSIVLSKHTGLMLREWFYASEKELVTAAERRYVETLVRINNEPEDKVVNCAAYADTI